MLLWLHSAKSCQQQLRIGILHGVWCSNCTYGHGQQSVCSFPALSCYISKGNWIADFHWKYIRSCHGIAMWTHTHGSHAPRTHKPEPTEFIHNRNDGILKSDQLFAFSWVTTHNFLRKATANHNHILYNTSYCHTQHIHIHIIHFVHYIVCCPCVFMRGESCIRTKSRHMEKQFSAPSSLAWDN